MHGNNKENRNMGLNGLWTVDFATAEEEHANMVVSEELNRGAVLVFRDGRVHGGGISNYFVGTFKLNGERVEMTVNAVRYNDLVPGPFGTAKEARIIFRGILAGDTMKLDGHIEDNPQARLLIVARKRVDIE